LIAWQAHKREQQKWGGSLEAKLKTACKLIRSTHLYELSRQEVVSCAKAAAFVLFRRVRC